MIPDKLREGLPDDLKEAQIVGSEIAGLDDSCRLYGPPGTGKSTQSSLRTGARAYEDPYITPGAMTVVTYRKALASVVRERLIDWGVFSSPEEVPPGSASEDNPFRFWNTIHAVAARASGFMELLPDDPEETVSGMVDYRSEYSFCRKLGIDRDPARPWEETKWTTFKDLYDYGKRNLLDIGEYRWIDSGKLPYFRADVAAERLVADFREQWGHTDCQAIAHRWEEFKHENDVYDFYEQLEYALVSDLPPVKHLVIDEYHDATPLMAQVSERWIEAADVAIVAGDPDQVVNSYAGASPEFFENLPERVDTDLPEIKLRRSWRCPDEHFHAAARVLRKQRQPPSLRTDGPGKFRRWYSAGFEFDNKSGRWKTPSPVREGSPVWLWDEFGPDIMYLTRTQRQADGVAAALDHAGVIYESQSTVGGDWEYRTDLLDALSSFEGMSQGEASEKQTIGIARPKAVKLARHSPQTYLSERKDRVIEDLRAGASTVTFSEFNNQVKSDWYRLYTRGRSSIRELLKERELSERDYVAMEAAWERYDPPFYADTPTRVLTIHASKGAEAQDVVLYDGITASVQEGMEESENLRENEARTWYVALTRSSERLHIVRDGWEWVDRYLPLDLEPRAAEDAQEYREVSG